MDKMVVTVGFLRICGTDREKKKTQQRDLEGNNGMENEGGEARALMTFLNLSN